MTLATRTPPELLVVLSMIVPALANAFYFAGEGRERKPILAHAFGNEFAALLPYSVMIAVALSAYHWSFWIGFSMIPQNPGVVLSILSLAIVFSPLLAAMVKQNQKRVGDQKTWVLPRFGAAACLVAAAGLFSLPDEATLNDLAATLKAALISAPAILIFLAMLLECLKDYFTIGVREDEALSVPTLGLREDDDISNLRLNIALAQANGIGCIFAMLTLLSGQFYLTAKAESVTPLELGVLIVISCLFILFGIVVRQIGENSLKSKKFKLAALHGITSLRPAVMVGLSALLLLIFEARGCSGEICFQNSLIQLSNPFTHMTVWDQYGFVATLAAMALLLIEFVRDGFFEKQ